MKRTLIALLLLSSLTASAQTREYRSELIKSICEKTAGSKIEGIGHINIVTEYDDMGRVSNVGLDIFDLDVMEMFPEEICTFLSRYFLEVLCWDETSIQQKLSDDKVVFLKGEPEDALKLTPDMAFNLQRSEDKEYTATWSNEHGPVLSISFPIQYQLLLGMPQIEVEKKVKDDLLCMPDKAIDNDEIPETEMLENGLYRSIPASFYYLEALNNCKYYKETKSGDLVPYFGKEHQAESAANLFQTSVGHNFKISVRQSLYGFEHTEYEITINQWLAYCQKNGLTSYFAIEKEDDDSLLALIISESKDLAYNHMLSVAIPKTFTSNDKLVFKAKLNAYIPTHNISELYQDEMTRANEK